MHITNKQFQKFKRRGATENDVMAADGGLNQVRHAKYFVLEVASKKNTKQ
jgi:hypothetical protein